MQERRLLWVVILSVTLFLSVSRPAYAYMDPGTTGSIFGMLAPFITIFLVFVGFLIRPFRRFFTSIVARVRGSRRVESIATNEQPLSDEPTGEEKSRENANEDLKS